MNALVRQLVTLSRMDEEGSPDACGAVPHQ